jgi:hypothetical protein
LLFFFFTFPAVGIAFKHVWKGKASIWPLIMYAFFSPSVLPVRPGADWSFAPSRTTRYLLLLGLTLLGFGFLLGTLTSQTQQAHITPDSFALPNLRPPPLDLLPPSSLSSSPSGSSPLSARYSSASPLRPSGATAPGATPAGKRQVFHLQPPMHYQLCKAQWGDMDIIDFGLLSWYLLRPRSETDNAVRVWMALPMLTDLFALAQGWPISKSTRLSTGATPTTGSMGPTGNFATSNRSPSTSSISTHPPATFPSSYAPLSLLLLTHRHACTDAARWSTMAECAGHGVDRRWARGSRPVV